MSQYVLFLALGLGTGAVYAVLAMGIVLTYKGTGIINFAAAAMATVPLYVYDDLIHGKLTLPLPFVPSINVGEAPDWLAIVVALAVSGFVGVAMQLGISRPLRTAPALAKVVAAIGVMLTLQAGLALKYGTDPRPRSALLPNDAVPFAGAQIPADKLILTAMVVALGAILATWLNRSRTGLSLQAAAENEQAAAFARLSPLRLGMVTWVLSSVLVGLVVILAGPSTGVITPTNLTLFVVPALAGALIGRLTSIWGALIGSLLLGAMQSEIVFLSQTKPWWPDWAKQGLTDALPFAFIVVALFAVGRSIPTRGDDVRSSLPPVIIPRNRPAVIAGVTTAMLLALLLTGGSYRFGIITSMAAALVALSLVIVTGYVGQISLAQVALAGVAGLTLSKVGAVLPFPLDLVTAGLVAAAAGLIVGVPALRIRGVQLAIVTLAAAVALEKFVFANPQLLSSTITEIDSPTFFGRDLAVRQGTDIARFEFGLMVLIVDVIVFVLVCNVLRAGSGRKMLAVRSNERAATSIGISVVRVKLTAFVLASFVAGLGGALIGYSRGQLSAESFGVFVGLGIVANAYLGGITSASGSMLAGAAGALGISFVVFDRILSLGKYYGILIGVSLIITVIFNPVGIAGKTRHDVDRLVGRFKARRSRSNLSDSSAPPARTQVTTEPAAVREIGDVVFRADGVTVRYGGLLAVDNVTVDVRKGEIVGLIGPNGAGKTSFIDAVTGFALSHGRIELRGRDVTAVAPHGRAHRGLVRTWQSIELFDDLSVEGNVRAADDSGSDVRQMLTDSVRPNPAPSESVGRAMTTMRISHLANRAPAELSLGEQKSVGLARALAMEPAVLLLDEPAAGLDTDESAAFGMTLQRIAASGVGCLLIDHDMHLVLGVCDRVYVLEFGRIIAEGKPGDVRRNPAVIAAYLGSPTDESEDGAGEHRRSEVRNEGQDSGTVVGAVIHS